MESLIYLDTHVLVWLSTRKTELLSPKAVAAIEDRSCVISPMCVLELQYLHEIGRLSNSGDKIVANLTDEIGLRICTIPLQRVVHEALHMRWTRDPFDRIITATALAADAQLLTRDATIRKHFRKAVWD
jgi:PIN domain nuclease of toxin-antitoxin system